MSRIAIRVVGAPLLLAALGGCLWIDHATGKPWAITAVLVLFSAASFHELCAMGRLKGLKPFEAPVQLLLLAPYAAFAAGWRHPSMAGLVPQGPLLALVVLCLVLAVFTYGRRSPADAAYTLFAGAWVLLLSAVLVFQLGGAWLGWLLFLVATGKGSDMAAYVVGKLVGRTKLAPEVSPNKTVEGGLAGLAAGTVLGVVVLTRVVHHGAPPGSLWALSGAVTLAAMLGDLAKSAVKRWAGVKDSGAWLPEFGGALDMCDSFLLAAPVAAALVAYF